MDEQWLREWSADECEYPPKRLREEMGELLAELDAARARIVELETGLAEMDEARVAALNLWRMSVHGVTSLNDLPTPAWTTRKEKGDS